MSRATRRFLFISWERQVLFGPGEVYVVKYPSRINPLFAGRMHVLARYVTGSTALA